jgi:hypothetical protein
MTVGAFRKLLENTSDYVSFIYKDKHCLIDYFIHGAGIYTVIWGDESIDFNNFNELMDAPVFDGKSLNEICAKIEID